MHESLAGWRATSIPCPSCYARLFRPKSWDRTTAGSSYHCLRCGESWKFESQKRIREQRIVILAAVSIVCLLVLAYAPLAAERSICLGNNTDGPSLCTHVPTDAQPIYSPDPDVMIFGSAIIFIPMGVNLVVRCRNWCGIVAVAILIGFVAGSVMGPLIIQHRYPDLYWENPDLFRNTIRLALGAITLSLPFSTLASRVFGGQSGTEKTKQASSNA